MAGVGLLVVCACGAYFLFSGRGGGKKAGGAGMRFSDLREEIS